MAATHSLHPGRKKKKSILPKSVGAVSKVSVLLIRGRDEKYSSQVFFLMPESKRKEKVRGGEKAKKVSDISSTQICQRAEFLSIPKSKGEEWVAPGGENVIELFINIQETLMPKEMCLEKKSEDTMWKMNGLRAIIPPRQIPRNDGLRSFAQRCTFLSPSN